MSDCGQCQIGWLGFEVRYRGSPVLFLLGRVRAVVHPVVPNRKRNSIQQVMQLLADSESCLSLQRDPFGVGRVTPFSAQDRDLPLPRCRRTVVDERAQSLKVLGGSFRGAVPAVRM